MTTSPHMEKLRQAFARVFGDAGNTIAVRAPGRVNLIGEHTDYNDGFVLPVGMDCAVYAAGRAVDGRSCRVYSINFDETISFDLDAAFGRSGGWGAYVEGTARAVEDRARTRLRGFEAAVFGDVPLGSGLSSSAALEVAIGYLLLNINNIDMPLPQLALACQEAENKYVGVQCGIMDQFASCLAREDTALFLDCRSLEFEYVPVSLAEHTLVVLNTKVPRTLAGSAYNDRRASCESGVAQLKKFLPHIRALRDVSADEFSELETRLDADSAAKCRHIVTENDRVLRGAASLQQGDLAAFGRLMNESHQSLRRDYQVSCRELDLLHDTALKLPGVLGERMTGAGFGGCAAALVEKDAARNFIDTISEVYLKETGLALEAYITAARAGAGLIHE